MWRFGERREEGQVLTCAGRYVSRATHMNPEVEDQRQKCSDNTADEPGRRRFR